MKIINNKLNLVEVILCFILFLLVFAYLSIKVINAGGDPLYIDTVVRDFIYDNRGEKGGLIYWLFIILSEFGDYRVIALVFVLVLIFTKCDNRALTFIIMIIASYLLNVGFKSMFARPRPSEIYFWMDEKSKSFPSAHATTATTMWLYVCCFVFVSKNRIWVKVLTTIFVVIIILGVMASRIVLGVHYFSDVIAGFSLGVMSFIVLLLPYLFMKKYNILNNGISFGKSRNEA